MEKTFLNSLKQISKYIIYALMFILVISMLLGTIDLFVLFIKKIVDPTPYPLLIDIEEMYSIFSFLLIIVVGYELFKSMYLILKVDLIPVKSILKIAAIALANKVITLNLKEIEINELFGLAALIVCIGVAYFFFHKDAEVKD
jgi:uncharacterized membrane protein (DUF373 family)